MDYKSKILTHEVLSSLRKQWAEAGEKVIFTNGCFDIIHRGHIDYLHKAAALGSKLIVALNSDRSVSNIKSPSRPIQDQDSRAEIMASLGCVDAVTIFNEDTPLEILRLLLPDILVKGGDYEVKDIVGYDLVTGAGGKVMTLDFLPGYSTSMIEKKIREN